MISRHCAEPKKLMQGYILSTFSSKKLAISQKDCIPTQNQGHSNYQYEHHESYYCHIYFSTGKKNSYSVRFNVKRKVMVSNTKS
jgi:hypothetical protein